jgi:hypothetical protein
MVAILIALIALVAIPAGSLFSTADSRRLNTRNWA